MTPCCVSMGVPAETKTWAHGQTSVRPPPYPCSCLPALPLHTQRLTYPRCGQGCAPRPASRDSLPFMDGVPNQTQPLQKLCCHSSQPALHISTLGHPHTYTCMLSVGGSCSSQEEPRASRGNRGTKMDRTMGRYSRQGGLCALTRCSSPKIAPQSAPSKIWLGRPVLAPLVVSN